MDVGGLLASRHSLFEGAVSPSAGAPCAHRSEPRIFLGTFVSAVVSMALSIPSITIEEIQADTMRFNVPAGKDSLADSRLTSVLSGSSRLIP